MGIPITPRNSNLQRGSRPCFIQLEVNLASGTQPRYALSEKNHSPGPPRLTTGASSELRGSVVTLNRIGPTESPKGVSLDPGSAKGTGLEARFFEEFEEVAVLPVSEDRVGRNGEFGQEMQQGPTVKQVEVGRGIGLTRPIQNGLLGPDFHFPRAERHAVS